MPRRKRESDKPKRPLTAYMIFSQTKRGEIKAGDPNVSFGEIGKKLGTAWQLLNQEERKPFEEKAQLLKASYLEEMKKYKELHPDSSDEEPAKKKQKKSLKKGKSKKGKKSKSKKKGKKGKREKKRKGKGKSEKKKGKGKGKGKGRKKKKKDVNAPKKPSSGFMWFSKETRPKIKEKNPSASFGDLGKLIGAEWRAMSDEQKTPFLKQAEVDKERYKADMANYKPPPESSSSESESSSSESESESSSSESESSSSENGEEKGGKASGSSSGSGGEGSSSSESESD